jgi:predicted O-methyltransferase YrrM
MRYQRRHPTAPWLTKAAIELLEDWLRPTDCGLEWGAGRSTLWFARRVQRLISIESDLTWYQKVDRQLHDQQLDHVTLHHSAVDYSRGKSDNHRYVQIGAELPPASQDFVLVDGHLRDFCARTALDKVKPGGLLIIDNANWYLSHPTNSPASVYSGENESTQVWQDVAERLKLWRSIWTSNGVTDTAFFIRPNLESN